MQPAVRKHIRKQSEDSQHSNGSRSRKQSKLWSVEDDQQLNQLYGECNGNWKQIAEKMNQRNASQCCQRWKKINPNRPEQGQEAVERRGGQAARRVRPAVRQELEEDRVRNGRPHQQADPRTLHQPARPRHQPQQVHRAGRPRHLPPLHAVRPQVERHLQKPQGKTGNLSPSYSPQENMVKNRFYSYIKRTYMNEEDEMIEEFKHQKIKDESQSQSQEMTNECDNDKDDDNDDDDDEDDDPSEQQDQFQDMMQYSMQPKLDTIQSTNTNDNESQRQRNSDVMANDSGLAIGAYNRNSYKNEEQQQQMVIDSLESNKGPFSKKKVKNEISFDEDQYNTPDKNKQYSFQPIPLPDLYNNQQQ